MYTVTVDVNTNDQKLKILEKKGILKIYRIRIENNRNKPDAILPTSIIGHIVLGSMRFGSARQTRVFERLKKIIGVNNIKDCIHLEAHIRDGRDYFVTEDHDVLDKIILLKEEFPQLKVITVDGLIKELKRTVVTA